MAETIAGSPASDIELITRARAGDAAAYGTLYERHVSSARRLARQLVTHQTDADDVVAEAFVRVLNAIAGGNGPTEAFRPYLLTAVRRVAVDQFRCQRRQIPTEDTELPDPGETFTDPVVAELDRSLIARAFLSLPERWSAVLWHTEVEESRPAEVAMLLGMSANAVAALRYRAREGLKQAYLQLHMSTHVAAGCQPAAGKLGTYVRGRLSRRQAREVENHLRTCADCRAACADLTSINDTLRGVLAPVILGTAATGYLGKAAVAGGLSHWLAGLRALLGRTAEFAVHRPLVPITAVAAAASIAVPTFTFIHPAVPHQTGAPVIAIARGHHSKRFTSTPAGTAPGTTAAQHHAPAPAPSYGHSPRPTPRHPSPTSSARPTPTRSAHPSPTGSPTPSTGPTVLPTPKVTVHAVAKLSVGVNVGSVLDLGVTAEVNVSVADPGTAATGALTASFTLPSGLTLLTLPAAGWSCATNGATTSCTHAALGAGAAADFSFSVLVLSLSGCGNPVIASVVSGDLSASGSSPQQVQCTAPLL
jgi:RNA polymerase sigma factor (sigma-70 family)